MSKLIFGLCALITHALIPIGAHAATRTYELEPAHSTVSFEVRNFGITKRRGVFDAVTGTVALDSKSRDGLIDILVDARSVRTEDVAVQTFLRGSSFLNVGQFAEIAYRGERIVFLGDAPSRIDGKLTLLGVTHDVTLTVSDYNCQEGSGSCVFNATASFRRSEFGMRQYLGLVSDEVRLDIHSVTREMPVIQLATSRDP